MGAGKHAGEEEHEAEPLARAFYLWMFYPCTINQIFCVLSSCLSVVHVFFLFSMTVEVKKKKNKGSIKYGYFFNFVFDTSNTIFNEINENKMIFHISNNKILANENTINVEILNEYNILKYENKDEIIFDILNNVMFDDGMFL